MTCVEHAVDRLRLGLGQKSDPAQVHAQHRDIGIAGEFRGAQKGAVAAEADHQLAALAGVRVGVDDLDVDAQCAHVVRIQLQRTPVDRLRRQHAKANTVLVQHFFDSACGLGRFFASGVDDEKDGALTSHCGPSSTARCTAQCRSSAYRLRSVSARSHRKYSTLPDGPGKRTRGDSDGMPAKLVRAACDGQHRARPQLGTVHHAAGSHLPLTDLELRLHHGNDIRVGRRASSQRGQHCGQRDERQVSDDGLNRAADRIRRELARIGPLDDDHPRIGPQRPGQLAVADIDGDHLARTAIQQDFGEPARRGPRVQTASALDADTETRRARR